MSFFEYVRSHEEPVSIFAAKVSLLKHSIVSLRHLLLERDADEGPSTDLVNTPAVSHYCDFVPQRVSLRYYFDKVSDNKSICVRKSGVFGAFFAPIGTRARWKYTRLSATRPR